MTAGASDGAGRAAAAVRYRPLDGDAPASRPEWQVLTAPLAASRALFPRRFARALDRLWADPLARSVPIVHAQRFFGSGLILSVDPNQLVFRVFDQVSDGRKALRLSNRFLDAADWSGILQRIELSRLHQEMVQLVEYGPRYRRMPVFRQMVRAARAGRPMARFDAVLDTEEKVHAYFGYYLELIESIRRCGFQPQSVLGGADVPRGAAVRGRNVRVERGSRWRSARMDACCASSAATTGPRSPRPWASDPCRWRSASSMRDGCAPRPNARACRPTRR